MIDLEKLRSFYYVIKEGSLIKASKALDKNHTTLSKHLTELEKGYNVKLFIRVRKRLELTEKGKELFTLAQKTIPNIENGAANILEGHKASDKTKRLRIITTSGASGVWVIRTVNKLLDEFPDTKISILTTNADIDFESSKADVGILPKFPTVGLSYRKLKTVRHGLYASRTYLKKFGTPKSLNELDQHRLISFYSDYEGNVGNVDWHLNKQVENNDIRESYLSVNSGFLIFEAGSQDMGIFPMVEDFEYLVESDLVRVLPEHVGPAFDICFVTRTNAVMSPPQQRLYELFLESQELEN